MQLIVTLNQRKIKRQMVSLSFFLLVSSGNSYRRLALKYHPLKNDQQPNILDRFNNLAEAYDVLSDRMLSLLIDE